MVIEQDVKDRWLISQLIVILQNLGIASMYYEDIGILAAIHKHGAGFADE